MPWGLHLDGTNADRAGLLVLLQRAPRAFSADWLVLEPADGSPGSIVVTDGLAREEALELARLGHDVVQIAPAIAGSLEVIRLKTATTMPLAAMTSRRVSGLLAALRPVPHVESGVPGEAVFVVDDERESGRLLERLLLLERHDGRVCDVEVDGAKKLLVRVTEPPVWLLMWCSDEPARGVRVYTRGVDDDAGLYTAFGHRHPLADRLGEALRGRSEVGLLDASGHLRRTRAPWPETTLHDALKPELPAATTILSPVPLTRRFSIQLRLGASLNDDGQEPELFLLDDEDDLFRLESFVEGASADEHSRLLLSRVSSPTGRTTTVLREAVRAGVPRLGARIATLLQRPFEAGHRNVGFVRVPSHDGLYLPPGKRLVPTQRRDDLRKLLQLDDAAAVVIDEDADGLTLTRIVKLDDEPISRLVTFLATSRRAELDRMLEEALLSFPSLALTRPKAEQRPKTPPPEKPREAKTPLRKVTIKPAAAQQAKSDDDDLVDTAALQLRERELEDAIVDDADHAAFWAELATVKLALDDKDDAATAASVAVFLDPASPAVATLLGCSTDKADLITLCTNERPTSAQAQRLCGLLLHSLTDQTERGEAVDDGILQQAEKVVSVAELPVPRRLQWAVLRRLHGRANDPIGMTRAKETVVGALNQRGLTEALDLPRFMRQRLAQGDEGGRRVQPRGEQLVVVERLLPRVVDQPLEISERREALLKAIFLNGLARLGGETRDLARAIESELPAHDGPVRILLRLYVSRAAFAVTSDGSPSAVEAWREEVKRALAAADRVEDRRVAEWLVKRSIWLRTDANAEPALSLRPALEKILTGVRGEPGRVVDGASQVLALTGCYDFEIAAALERLLDQALQSGREDVIEQMAEAAIRAAPGLRILAHRARLLGAVVKAAATAGAADLVERALDDVAAIAGDRNVPSVRDLLLAVRPALFALRRLGALDAARRFLSAFEPITLVSGKETGPLAAALAEGFHQLGEYDPANALIERALGRATGDASVGHVDRYEAGAAVIGALAHWPHAVRAAHCEALFIDLRRFVDTFTTQGWFPTHQLLIAERLIECLVDDVTVRSDRLQAFLDHDEARVRRRILGDWRAAVA